MAWLYAHQVMVTYP